MQIVRFLLLVVALNVVRYLVGGTIGAFTYIEDMHRIMPLYPEIFADFEADPTLFPTSFLYNFMLWLAAAWIFHLVHPVLKGGWVAKSLKGYGLSLLFFVSLAAVYMNHYTEVVRPFYLWSMVDATIAFTVVALANAWLYPRIMGPFSKAGPAASSN